MEPASARPGSNRRNWIAVVVVALGVAWLIWQWDGVARLVSSPARPESSHGPEGSPVPTPADRESAESASANERAERAWEALVGSPPAWPEDFAEPQDCQAVEADLTRICRVLDERDVAGPAAGTGGTCAWVRSVAETLAARPPDVRSELKSYERMLENVFHVFRTLGRERAGLLRRIVWEEQEIAEPGGLAVLRWLVSRETCARTGETPITREALYDYSAFLFSTMGGQAYLRRRSPRTESLVSLYALVILDRAQREGYDPSGIDLRPEIQRTRALLEREPLVFREHYLLALDRMAERRKGTGNPS